MAGLSVIFRAVDEISSRFDAMVSAGTRALDSFDQIGAAADSSYDVISEGAAGAADAMERAASATDYWTDRIGNYDREAMQAIYSIEELVEMGYMSEEALNHLGDALDEAADDLEDFGDEAEDAGDDAEDFGERSKSAVEGLDKLLATVGIVAALTAIGSAFMGCSQAAAKFETNVAMVSTVADTTVLSAGELSAQISDLSMDTARNVNELADASYNAISAGVATEAAVATVGEASKLATAGFTSSSSALSVLTTTLNAYGLEASEVTNISDSLVTSQNLGVLTIDQMASSMGKAISTASAYSVDLYNLESGYISLTKAGISVEESTTYISSMFNELGSAGSNVATIITEETGMSFGQLMNAGYSLADVLDIVYESAGRDGEAMMNLWGSAEAGKAANAIINQGLDTFNSNLDKLANSAGTTQVAYEAMTNTTAFSTERMENSFNNLSIAIGNDLNPVVSQFQNGIADVTDGFTKLINEHPAITAVLVGVTVGLGAVTLGLTAYSAAAKIAAVVNEALGATMTVALGPIMLAVGAIVAVTTAVIYMANAEDEAEKAQASLTESSQEMADELENLQEQYDALAEAGAADTVEAYQLKNQIDELSEAFENNKQTIGDLIAYNKQLKTTLDEIANTYDETVDSIDQNESDSKSLIAQLAAMSESADLSGGQLEIMQSIVDRLNGSYEGLNLTLDETNGKLNMSVEDLWAVVSESAEQERAQANMNALMDYLAQYQEAQRTYDEAMKTQVAAKAEYERSLKEDWAEEHPFLAWSGIADGVEMNWSGSVKDAYHVWDQAKEATSGAKENFDSLTESIEACYTQMGYSEEEIDEMMAELALASASVTEMAEKLEQEKEAVENTSDGYIEARNVLSQYSGVLQSLCEEYDAVYEAALQSIQGQYSLWDEVKNVAAMSSQGIKDALQSQIDYWNSYNENMASLTERAGDIEGLSDMMASLADGSEKSAAMLAGMENMNDADLSAVVQQYNNLQTAQRETAASVADLETEFSEKLANMQTEMGDMVDGMDLSAEAKANAKATMDAYVGEIQAGVAKAQTAIDSLNFANNNLSSGGYHEYAAGTLDAEPGLALVGEEGPELVNFGGGEVVYTAAETSNILARSNDNKDFYVSPPEEAEGGDDSGDKTITLRIEGAGEMKVSGSGTSKEDIVNVLVENMRGVLMDILRQEIMEEGEMSYEF
jgi:TP901 family phage tail tape measure protein